MRRTDCWQLRDRLVHTLSGGERQRVLLAACLAQAAEVLLLDEPSTHLDVDQQLHCFALLQEEAARGGACVAVTHDLNLALTYATRLVVLADGRVALDVSVDQAARRSDWLTLFSPRLQLTTTASGRPWVSYS
jgi:iron complex transport system ATP-binding protein